MDLNPFRASRANANHRTFAATVLYIEETTHWLHILGEGAFSDLYNLRNILSMNINVLNINPRFLLEVEILLLVCSPNDTEVLYST